MPSLPVLSGRQVVQVFVALGWHVARQRGSHISCQPNQIATVSVPDHKEVAKGTLRNLIRAAGLTAEAFVAETKKV